MPGPISWSGRSATRTILAMEVRDGSDSRDHDAELVVSRALRIAKEVIGRRGGRISVASEKGLLAELASPTDALLSASALHSHLGELPHQASARVAVTSGEVLRRGRRLFGRAVVEAEDRLSAVPWGETLFSEAVYLSMNRSEIRCEPHGGLGHARLHRLLPFEGEKVEGRRRLLLWQRRAKALVVSGLLMTLTLALALSQRLASGKDDETVAEAFMAMRLDDAEALVDAWLERNVLDPRARTWKGRILLARGEVEEARDFLLDAVHHDPETLAEPEVAEALVGLLAEKGADTSWIVPSLVEGLEDALLEATRSDRYWLRWNAFQTLERLGLGDRVDLVGLYLLDLDHPTSCGVRMRAARELVQIGRADERVLPALREAQTKELPAAVCNLPRILEESIANLSP